MTSSLTPAPAASRICARLILRAACLPPLSNAESCVRSMSLRSARYRMFIVDPAPSRTKINPAADSRRDFTPKQGQYLAIIHVYTLVNRRPPAAADLMRFFRVTPPSVHEMVLNLEKAGLISRQPGVHGVSRSCLNVLPCPS
jgi:DNA-binding MarR family transcriptional regulator